MVVHPSMMNRVAHEARVEFLTRIAGQTRSRRQFATAPRTWCAIEHVRHAVGVAIAAARTQVRPGPAGLQPLPPTTSGAR